MYKIANNSNNFSQISDFERICSDFLPHAQKYLGFDKPVDIELVSDMENAKDPFGKTAYYDPNAMKITLFIDKRHVKDILRSLSHELVHHSQNCKGEFSGGINTGPGYAQKDPYMRKRESEAYLHGNGLMWRDFEDEYKQKNLNLENVNSKVDYLLEGYLKGRKNMSNILNEEKQAEAWKFTWKKTLKSGKENLKSITHVCGGCPTDQKEPCTCTRKEALDILKGTPRWKRVQKWEKLGWKKHKAEAVSKPPPVDDQPAVLPATRDGAAAEQTKESRLYEMTHGKKNEMLFEDLIKKWCK